MIIKYIHLLRILISLRAIDVLPVVNLLLYNRNTLYTYNFYSYIFDRCYQLLPLLSTVVSIINLEEYGPIYTVLYCNVLYSTVLYCTILYRTIMYRTVLYFKYFASKVPSSPPHPHLPPPTSRPIHRYPFS